MPDPILDPAYWRDRLKHAGEEHLAIFRCPKPLWEQIEKLHREILYREIKAYDSILDGGCGWGRAIGMMPPWWNGPYVGIDVSDDFIAMARKRYPQHTFHCDSMIDLLYCIPPVFPTDQKFDWGLFVSIKSMIVREISQEHWDAIESGFRRVCKKLLFLEYNVNEPMRPIVDCLEIKSCE